jgi:hypothetical protein
MFSKANSAIMWISFFVVNHKNILYVLFTYILEFETLEKIPLIDIFNRIDKC